jgi:hypothetical protein
LEQIQRCFLLRRPEPQVREPELLPEQVLLPWELPVPPWEPELRLLRL